MIINEENKTVKVSKLEMHRNMMTVFSLATAGYKVIVTSYGKPVAFIISAVVENTEFIQE